MTSSTPGAAIPLTFRSDDVSHVRLLSMGVQEMHNALQQSPASAGHGSNQEVSKQPPLSFTIKQQSMKSLYVQCAKNRDVGEELAHYGKLIQPLSIHNQVTHCDLHISHNRAYLSSARSISDETPRSS
jgi:hypothetical protein